MASHRIRRRQYSRASTNAIDQPTLSLTLPSDPVENNLLLLSLNHFEPVTVDESWTLLHEASEPINWRRSTFFYNTHFRNTIYYKYADNNSRTVEIANVGAVHVLAFLQEMEITEILTSDRVPGIQLLPYAASHYMHIGYTRPELQGTHPDCEGSGVYIDIEVPKPAKPLYHMFIDHWVRPTNESFTPSGITAGEFVNDNQPTGQLFNGDMIYYRGVQTIWHHNNTGIFSPLMWTQVNWHRDAFTSNRYRRWVGGAANSPQMWVDTTAYPSQISSTYLTFDEGIPISEDHIDGESIEALPPTITTSDISDLASNADLTNIEIAVGEIQSSELSASTAILELSSFEVLPPQMYGETTLSIESSLDLQSILVGTVQISHMAVFTGDVAQRVTASMSTDMYTVRSNTVPNNYTAIATSDDVLEQTVIGAVF